MNIIEKPVIMLVSLSDGCIASCVRPLLLTDDCTDEEIKSAVTPVLLQYMHALIVDGYSIVIGSALCPFESVGVGWCAYRTVLELMPLFDSSIDDIDDCPLY